MVKKCIIQVSQSKNVKNAVMEAILKEIDLEVRAQKKLKTSERSSAYSAMDTILKKNTRQLIHGLVGIN
jgi:hypothetical protein